jgi:hypothetical protein
VTAWAHHAHDSFLTPTVWVRVLEGEALASGITDDHDENYRRCAKECVQFVVAAGIFMRQKITTVETRRPDRHARKRIQAAGWPFEMSIDVVRLRARELTNRASIVRAEALARINGGGWFEPTPDSSGIRRSADTSQFWWGPISRVLMTNR